MGQTHIVSGLAASVLGMFLALSSTMVNALYAVGSFWSFECTANHPNLVTELRMSRRRFLWCPAMTGPVLIDRLEIASQKHSDWLLWYSST